MYAFSRCGYCHPDLITVVETAAGTLLKEAAADRGYVSAGLGAACRRLPLTEGSVRTGWEEGGGTALGGEAPGSSGAGGHQGAGC